MNSNNNPPSHLTPGQIDQMVNGVIDSAPPPTPPGGEPPGAPQGTPPALTPAKIEALMARALSTPEILEMATFFRPADAEVDPGAHDLIPLANVVAQVSRRDPESFSITVMYATWALATFARLQAGADEKVVVS